MPLRPPAGFIRPGFDPLKNPNAPTIGTATGGSGSASVTFTAPANTGGGAITGFTVVSIPDGVIGTGVSSPITVSGLTVGTAYTFKVFATNAYGPSSFSAASNSVTPLPAIGSAFGGGFFAGQISTAGNNIADYNLIVGPVASTQSSLQWKTTNTSTEGTSSFINGPANTAAMIAAGAAAHPCANFCVGLSVGGFSDWYMAARNEIEICYFNLKPTTTANEIIYGINANAVPARASNYTAGTPAQTSATAFKSGGTEAFSATFYWCSTSYNYPATARRSGFSDGSQGSNSGVTASNPVRAVRRVPV